MKIGQLIKELRYKRGLTQEDVADKTGISVRSIQRIENGAVESSERPVQLYGKRDARRSIADGIEEYGI